MRKFVNVIWILIILLFLCFNNIYSQELNVIVQRTSIDSIVGSEMVFDFEVINISQDAHTVFEVRTINNLPDSWQSSLCFGESCFPPELDSVATTQPFGEPLEPGDTLYTSLHVAALENEGTANVQIQIGTLRNSTERTIIDLTANAIISSVTGKGLQVDDYHLSTVCTRLPKSLIKPGRCRFLC